MTINIMDWRNGELDIMAVAFDDAKKKHTYRFSLDFKEEAASMTVKELYDRCIDELSEIVLDERSPWM